MCEYGDSERRLIKYISDITGSDRDMVAYAKAKWNSIAKPLYGMGMLEDYVSKIVGIVGDISLLNKCVAVMCADNGVVAEGVTQTDSSVTAVVAHNMTIGQASVTNMSLIAGADVFTYDVGMLTDVEGTINRKGSYGTNNLHECAAMKRDEAIDIIINGIEIVRELKEKGYNIIASGEMGIGNTTTSSAVIAVLFGVDAKLVTGCGAGLSKEKISHKAVIINEAIAKLNPDASDPIDVLAKVGGYDIAAMCGLFLGGAYYKVPVIIDGLISSVAALLAKKLCGYACDYMLASHMSAEPAAVMVMEELGLKAPINCNMALGEGTGAVALMPLLDMAFQVFNHMPTFKDINIEEYKPL